MKIIEKISTKYDRSTYKESVTFNRPDGKPYTLTGLGVSRAEAKAQLAELIAAYENA